LALYPGVVRVAWQRVGEYLMFGAREPQQMRSMLASCGIVLLCCMQVQFCFMMAAAVVRLLPLP
jgi:hypothetical protein